MVDPTAVITSELVEAIMRLWKRRASNSTVNLPALREETEKQELQMREAEAQARVAQELAIARRIESAAEVEMEEYYDYSGEGHVGASSDGKAVSVGAGGSGRRVSKRVYRFRNTATPQPSGADPEPSAGDPGAGSRSRRKA